MSGLPAWDVPAPSSDNGVFNPPLEPSMAYANTPTSSNFDFPMQNPHMQQQRMQNGSMRNGSPAYQGSMYQTTPVVPSKRPLVDYTASPRQNSRSQTPQQTPYPGFQGAVNGQQAPTPYQHLQQGGSSNASPSPIMQNQHFNPQVMPPRMQTASPSPFSPAAQNFGSQASPPQSDYGARVDTPSNGGQPYMQGTPYMNGPNGNQSFTPPPGGMPMGGTQGGPASYPMNNMSAEHQRKQQSMVRQLQATNAAAQQRHAMNPMTGQPNPMASYQQQQQQAVRAQQIQRGLMQPTNPEQFIGTVTAFMHQRGLPFSPTPYISGHGIHVTHIYTTVMKLGGSRKVTASNLWPTVAAKLNVHPGQFPTAPQELQAYWHNNLLQYEQLILQTMKQKLTAAQSYMPQQMHPEGQMPREQFSPTKQPNPQPDQASMMQSRRPSSADFQTPAKPTAAVQPDSRQPQMNGFPPGPETHASNQPSAVAQGQPGYSAQSTPSRPQQPPFSVTPAGGTASNSTESSRKVQQDPFPVVVKQDTNNLPPLSWPIGETFRPSIYHLQQGKDPVEEPHMTYAGLPLLRPRMQEEGMLAYTARREPPTLAELDIIDIRALIMSLKSGINGEVKFALQTLELLFVEMVPNLDDCEDLLETLIECAEDQVELLAEDAPEVSDAIQLPPHEDLIRCCHQEVNTLQDVPEYGTREYDMERAVDRLMCISTLVRYMASDPKEPTRAQLADPFVVRFYSTVIRYLGTRNMLLRTYRNTLEFVKDLVVYLQRISDKIDLPSKEEAMCILQFLVSFAPLPAPTSSQPDEVIFTYYTPSQHRYLPSAVDALAKLLARGDPNRALFKSIFAADVTSSPSYDLLSRSFGLAIAPLPAYGEGILPIIEMRSPTIIQGLLAAENLVSLMPQNEHALARSWLSSQDGFANNLLRLIILVCVETPPMPPRNQANKQMIQDRGFDLIGQNGIGVLRKLSERAKDADGSTAVAPSIELYKKSKMLDVLRSTTIDRDLLQQLCLYVGLKG